MPEKKKKEKLIQDEDLDKVSGGSALDDAPVVDEHDYDDDTREKINPQMIRAPLGALCFLQKKKCTDQNKETLHFIEFCTINVIISLL